MRSIFYYLFRNNLEKSARIGTVLIRTLNSTVSSGLSVIIASLTAAALAALLFPRKETQENAE